MANEITYLTSICQSLGVDVCVEVDTAHQQIDRVNRSFWPASNQSYELFLRAIRHSTDRTDLPFLIGSAMGVSRNHLTYFIFASSCNLGQAFSDSERFYSLTETANAHFKFSSELSAIWVNWHANPDVAHTHCLIHLLGVARAVTNRPIAPTVVMVKSIDDAKIMENYEIFFQCKLIHGDSYGMVFDSTDLDAEFLPIDQSLWNIIDKNLTRSLLIQNDNQSFLVLVQQALEVLLPQGCCTLDETAEYLGMERRTVQRRLSDINLTFKDVRRQVRINNVQPGVLSTSLSKAQISCRLGFRDTNSFYRCYRRWQREGLV